MRTWMARVSYSAIASLDGYVADERGDFSWAAPDEEVHAFANDLEQRQGFAAEQLLAQMATLQTNPRVIQLMEPPATPGQRFR